jgi:ribosomal protein L40E
MDGLIFAGLAAPTEDDMVTRLLMPVLIGALVAPNVAAAIQEATPAEKETKICRKSETRTGTRIKTGRKCKSAEEWQKEDEERSRVPLSLTVTEGQPDGTSRPRPQ